MQQKVRPGTAIVAVCGLVLVIGSVVYLSSSGFLSPRAAPPPGIAEMKRANEAGGTLPTPVHRDYIPPNAPTGVRQMIQTSGGANPAPPPHRDYLPPGAPPGVRSMIQSNSASPR